MNYAERGEQLLRNIQNEIESKLLMGKKPIQINISSNSYISSRITELFGLPVKYKSYNSAEFKIITDKDENESK